MADDAGRKAPSRPLARLREEIEAKGGIAVIPMWKLRDHAGWDRLGVNVVKDIAAKMRRGGLATLPAMEVLPYSQGVMVRVYVTEGRLGEVIAAVLAPSAGGDKLLREIGSDDAAEVLEAVRDLVCG